MTVDRAWLRRNIGFDPVTTTPPFAAQATRLRPHTTSRAVDLQREIIDFDSDGPDGQAFIAFSKATGLLRFTDIPWPAKLAPRTDTTVRRGMAGALPEADVLIVTWTVDEGHALSRVLTPGKDSRNDYHAYRHNFARIGKKMFRGCPALDADRLGAWWTATIGTRRIVVFKSESHLSQDTDRHLPAGVGTLPNEDLWTQIIQEVKPSLVITTGTAGGIGSQCEVGDVVVSPITRFDCNQWMKSVPWRNAVYRDDAPSARNFAAARRLFRANADQLPTDNTRPPRITRAAAPSASVVTTDFFGFDTSANSYGLKGLGDVCEMGDAVLGLVAQRLGAAAPRWVAVRNVSDPQIKSEGTLAQQGQVASQIYKAYGRWSSVCSAIVCWALVAP